MPAAVPIAIGGATLVGGALSANAQSKAAKSAANAQQAASDAAIGEQRRQYNDTRNLLTPSSLAGAEAQARQMLMLGYTKDQVKSYLQSTRNAFLSSPDGEAVTAVSTSTPSNPGAALSGFGVLGGLVGSIANNINNQAAPNSSTTTTTAAPAADTYDYGWIDSYNPEEYLTSQPGYQFQYGQGQKALERSQAAKGQLFSGATGKALEEYGQGIGASYWDKLFGNLGQLAGQGQDSTGQVINVGTNTANNIGANLRYAGDARASAYNAAGNAWGNFWGNTFPGAVGSGIGYKWPNYGNPN